MSDYLRSVFVCRNLVQSIKPVQDMFPLLDYFTLNAEMVSVFALMLQMCFFPPAFISLRCLVEKRVGGGSVIIVYACLYKAHHSCAIKTKCTADKTTVTKACMHT